MIIHNSKKFLNVQNQSWGNLKIADKKWKFLH